MYNLFSSQDFQQMQQYHYSGVTRSYKFRKEQLQVLKKAIHKYEGELSDALYKDLHKSVTMAYISEIGFVNAEISYALKHLSN